MTQEQWTAVDQYITDMLVPADEALDHALKTSDAAGLPAISVTPNQGKLLALLAELTGAESILEIGTLGGYSTIWLARALRRGGRLITLEREEKHAAVARENLAYAGLSEIVEVRLGGALDSLAQIAKEGRRPFDFVFIDADKQNNPDYFAWSVEHTRPGGVIVVDNVVRGGRVLDGASEDVNVQGVRRLYERLGAERRVTVTAVQTVGSKGWDGFAVARVRE